MRAIGAGFRVGGALRVSVVVAALLCLLGACVLSCTGTARPVPGAAGAAPDRGCAPGWVRAWQAAAQPGPAGSGAVVAGRTVRMVVRPQVTGSQVRVRLSNAYGREPLHVGGVSAARSAGGPELVASTVSPVAFRGRAGVVLAPGAEIQSDPVPLVAEAGRPLVVSVFVASAPDVLTRHELALQTSYLSGPGDDTLDPGGTAFDSVGSWMVLTGVDVLAPRPVNTVVLVGDSITDGMGSGSDADERLTDALGRRLTAAGGPAVMAVLNAGIARNRLLTGGPAEGDAPLARFARDVAAGRATDVVLHVGTNDIAAGAGAADIVAGMLRFAEHARAAGTRVFLTTITPSDAGAHGTPAAVATRGAVNAWVRAQGREHADGVFDLAAAVADPAHPARLVPVLDSGDGLHLSPAGYRALADAIDVEALTGSPCLAETTPARVLVSNR